VEQELPTSVSTKTILNAQRLVKNALAMDLNPGTVRWVPGQDMLFFMFNNISDLCLIYITPSCYLVEMNTEDEHGNLDENYFMLKNIRNFLFKLRGLSFTHCEDIVRPADIDIDEDEVDFLS
jgi:hypothetical protein